jgi:hypothetical protein
VLKYANNEGIAEPGRQEYRPRTLDELHNILELPVPLLDLSIGFEQVVFSLEFHHGPATPAFMGGKETIKSPRVLE